MASDAKKQKWNEFYAQYEEFVGLAEVQNAQQEVTKAEKKFLAARTEERAKMREVAIVRDKLKHVRERLSHVDYSNPLYPQLANEQHGLVTLEEKLQTDMETIEEKERDTFLELSGAMRDSYEKERARVERTKNWSLIGTVVGTIIGMFSSVYINRVRTKDLKDAILDKDTNSELKDSIEQVIPHTQTQYTDIKEEIRNLQVCLVNKLLALPSEKESSSDSSIGEENSDENTLESLAKILQSFQSQLHFLLEKSAKDQTALSTQNDNLYQQIEELKIKKEIDSKAVEEIYKISDKLQKIKVVSNDDDGATVISLSAEHRNDSPRRSRLSVLKDIAIWGTALSALFYIIKVD